MDSKKKLNEGTVILIFGVGGLALVISLPLS